MLYQPKVSPCTSTPRTAARVLIRRFAQRKTDGSKAIKLWLCCSIVLPPTSITGISVTAGTQYWIVLKTNAKESNTWAAFNVNDTDQIDPAPTAFYCSQDKGGSCGSNDKWIASQSIPGPAFAVSGK